MAVSYMPSNGNLTSRQTANLLQSKDSISYGYEYNRLKTTHYPLPALGERQWLCDHPKITYFYAVINLNDRE
ncbi:MAG TPA: hypothetical protein VFP20_06980 [Bacteroidales bacterium]|nr:hypothetical protein [Bacteroidales bacterium]